MLIRRNTVSAGGPASLTNPPPPVTFKDAPALWEFLTATRWDEAGEPRVPGTVMLFYDDAGLKVMFNDKDGSCVAFSVLDGGCTLLKALEKALTSPTLDWRPAKKFKR